MNDVAASAPAGEPGKPKPLIVHDERAGSRSPAERHVVPEPNSLMQALVKAASDSNTDIVKMERLFAMHKEMRAIDAEAAFNAAMARTQKSVVPIARDRFNGQTSSWYATQAAICEAIVPVYSVEGLSVSFDSEDCPKENWFRTVAFVSHEAGHTRKYHQDFPLDDVGIKGAANKTKVHAVKSTATYAKNTLLCSIFNIATRDKNEDDDGNAAGDIDRTVLTEEHQKHITDLCAAISPTTLSNVLREYKAANLEQIADSEFDTIVSILKNIKAKRDKANAPAGATT